MNVSYLSVQYYNGCLYFVSFEIVAAAEAPSRGRGRHGIVVAWHVTNPFDMAAARPPLRYGGEGLLIKALFVPVQAKPSGLTR